MFFNQIETTNIEEAKEVGNHNFMVESQRLFTERELLVPDKKAIVKAEDQIYLGTVGKDWEPIQPYVLYDLANKLMEATEGNINGVFNMFDGAVIGISFKLAEREYIRNDKIDLNFIMLTAFNGMYGLSGSALTYRHASNSMANTSNKVFNLRHTKFVSNRIEVVKDMLKYYNREISSFDTKMNKLVTQSFNSDQAGEWFKKCFPTPKTQRSEKILDNSLQNFLYLLHNGRGSNLSGVKGTRYGAWCALIEYINHDRKVRVHNDRDEEEVKFQSINFGTANKLVQNGLRNLMDFEFDESEFMV
jgi:hypothetical protein